MWVHTAIAKLVMAHSLLEVVGAWLREVIIIIDPDFIYTEKKKVNSSRQRQF